MAGHMLAQSRLAYRWGSASSKATVRWPSRMPWPEAPATIGPAHPSTGRRSARRERARAAGDEGTHRSGRRRVPRRRKPNGAPCPWPDCSGRPRPAEVVPSSDRRRHDPRSRLERRRRLPQWAAAKGSRSGSTASWRARPAAKASSALPEYQCDISATFQQSHTPGEVAVVARLRPVSARRSASVMIAPRTRRSDRPRRRSWWWRRPIG